MATATFSPKGSWGDRICDASFTPGAYSPLWLAVGSTVPTGDRPLTGDLSVVGLPLDTVSAVVWDDLDFSVKTMSTGSNVDEVKTDRRFLCGISGDVLLDLPAVLVNVVSIPIGNLKISYTPSPSAVSARCVAGVRPRRRHTPAGQDFECQSARRVGQCFSPKGTSLYVGR